VEIRVADPTGKDFQEYFSRLRNRLVDVGVPERLFFHRPRMLELHDFHGSLQASTGELLHQGLHRRQSLAPVPTLSPTDEVYLITCAERVVLSVNVTVTESLVLGSESSPLSAPYR
jgi:hypothetical protein